MNVTTILVPIRYPLTEQSTRTLESAAELAETYESAHLIVLHVNLFHRGKPVRVNGIKRAIREVTDPRMATVLVRRGFILEEVILDEALHNDVDVIVIGESRRPPWRRWLSRVLGHDHGVASTLEEQTAGQVEVVG